MMSLSYQRMTERVFGALFYGATDDDSRKLARTLTRALVKARRRAEKNDSGRRTTNDIDNALAVLRAHDL